MNNLEKRTAIENARIPKAQSLLKEMARAINSIEVNEDFADIVDHIRCREGKIITTGMGKAGIAMRKFASTLCSLGFPATYLHPGESSHGDLGVIQSKDILFVASTSGKTREVLETLDSAINLGVTYIVGITSHPDSPIREKADFILDMGEIEEAGELGLAPTTSILVMLAITDALALVASEEDEFTKEEYGRYHHGGYLGAKARNDGQIY